MLGQRVERGNFPAIAPLAILHGMRCRLCGDPAGWWRRRCAGCRLLWQAWLEHGQHGMRRLLDAFLATGASPAKIERFLDAEPNPGGGTIRDLMAAEMSNQLLAALGQPATQSGRDTKRLRKRGAWRAYDRRPTD
jgi:hypothetical protein